MLFYNMLPDGNVDDLSLHGAETVVGEVQRDVSLSPLPLNAILHSVFDWHTYQTRAVHTVRLCIRARVSERRVFHTHTHTTHTHTHTHSPLAYRLQVVHYSPGQFYQPHHDWSAGLGRWTVAWRCPLNILLPAAT